MIINETERVESTLSVLHRDAKNDYKRIRKGLVKSIFKPLAPADFKNAYLPISQTQGIAMREIVIKNNCKTIVEFGTSFGISTIYLADAARQTGGKVITTELIKSKANIAAQNIDDAGLSEFVSIKIGDAMETLKNFTDPIDFLFLDGWKDLYLPLFKKLEPYFNAKSLIYADNMDMSATKEYAAYILDKNSYYNTKSLHNGKVFLTKIK